MPARMRPLDAHDAAGILAIGLLFICLAGIVVAVRGGPDLVSAVILQGGFLAAPALYARFARLPLLRASGLRRLRPAQIVAVLAASLGSMWLLKGLVDFQHDVLGLDTAPEKEGIGRFIRSMDGYSLLLLVIVPAFCEEALFRGILLRGFASGFSPVRGVLYTSLIFAILHAGQGWGRPMLMVFVGAYFGTVVLLTDSLWAGILAHAANNGAVLLVLNRYGDRMEEMRAAWWMLALSAVVFFGALGWLAAMRPGGKGETGGL